MLEIMRLISIPNNQRHHKVKLISSLIKVVDVMQKITPLTFKERR